MVKKNISIYFFFISLLSFVGGVGAGAVLGFSRLSPFSLPILSLFIVLLIIISLANFFVTRSVE